jgi:TPR repeat protein
MSFWTRTTVEAFFVFAIICAVRAEPTEQIQDIDVSSLRQQAAAGDAQAQFALADHYFRGVGVAQDYGQALIWYRASEAQGYAPALNQLGYMHQHKSGLPQDYKRAVSYYRLAANKGYDGGRKSTQPVWWQV